MFGTEKEATIGRNIRDRFNKKWIGNFRTCHCSRLKGKRMIATFAPSSISRAIFEIIICAALGTFHELGEGRWELGVGSWELGVEGINSKA